uniref:CCHC-type domain-containing protein n=1 Tax=Bactrocera tryoni TaxID=59916 RepID=A0A142LX34_BACRY|nr:hypothetical protein [Bactrocera tryoni]
MPPGRKRRTKALAGSGESAASTVVDDSTSGGEGEATGTTVRSPPRSKARLGSPRNEGGSEGGSGSCGGSANVASAEKVVTRAGSPRNVGGVEGGSGCCGGSAIVATTEKAVARTGSSRNEGGSGSGSVAHPSSTVGKGVGVAKEGAAKVVTRVASGNKEGTRALPRGAVVVGGGAVSHVAAAKRITGELNELVFEAKNFDAGTAKGLMELASKYEALLMTVITENAHLRGQVDALRGSCGGHSSTPSRSMPAPSAPMPAPPAPVLDAITPVTPKPVETWSVVVRSKGPATSSKEVIKKVVKEVGPSLGVRVHEVRPIKGGGAVIRTPSVLERERVANNKKFEEVGLDVSVNRKLGRRVVVQGVHTEIPHEEFMEDLLRLNLKDFSPASQRTDVRMVSRPWKVAADGSTNVVLEGTDKLMSALLETGRCYIKWFSFRVRPDSPVAGCFRCMGFDHRVAECRAKADVCRRCGQEGHKAASCVNAPHCRNCEFKGRPAGHLMMSAVCPIYCGIVERALARH